MKLVGVRDRSILLELSDALRVADIANRKHELSIEQFENVHGLALIQFAKRFGHPLRGRYPFRTLRPVP